MLTLRRLGPLAALWLACSSAPSAPTKVESPKPPAAAAEPGAADPAPPTLRLDPAVARPLAYAAHLHLDPAKSDFTGVLEVDVELGGEQRTLWLNRIGLEIAAVEVSGDGGAAAAGRVLASGNEDFVGIELPAAHRRGQVHLRLEYRGKLGDHKDYSGIFVQEEGGHRYIFTQFQPAGAREVFPHFDQPEFKVPWTVAITAPEGQLAFSNTPETGRKANGDGTVTFKFAQSKPLPSYLIAVAVGPFEVVDLGTGGREKTPMRIIVPRGRTGETAYAARHMKEILTWLEDYFDLAYPYAKLDSVALPRFFGAMEHPGLITYAASILLVEPGEERRSWEESHFRIVAHEIAHQWFGNLVTLRWWNDLWLNESFADWMANKLVDQLRPQWSRDIRRVETRESAMGADSVEGAARIRHEIKSKDDFFAGVGGILYAKGTTVISMFEQWIGEDEFRAALRGYIRQHSWKTAVADDFFAALAGASDPKLPAAFATFIDQTGVPLVEAELECPGKGKAPTLSLRQSRYVPTGSKAATDEQLWHIPVCVDHAAGKKVATSCTLMTEREASLALETDRCPDWVLGNADAKGYYRVLYRGKMLDRLLAATARLSPAERLGLIGDVSALSGAGKIEVGAALALIPRLERDKSPHVIARAATIAAGIKELVPPSLAKNYRRFLTRTFGARARRLGWDSVEGEDNAVTELRSRLVPLVAVEGGDRALIAGAARLAKKWTTDPSAIETEMLAATLGAAARGGDAALYDKIRAAALEEKPGQTRAALIAALGQFPDPALTERTLSLMAGDEIGFQDLFQIFGGIASDPARRQRLYDFVKANYDAIAAKMPEMARGFLVFAAVPFCDKAHQDDARAFFGPRNKDIQNGERALTQAMNAIDVCIARREREGPGVAKFLRRY